MKYTENNLLGLTVISYGNEYLLNEIIRDKVWLWKFDKRFTEYDVETVLRFVNQGIWKVKEASINFEIY